jgi:hypothetical protein
MYIATHSALDSDVLVWRGGWSLCSHRKIYSLIFVVGRCGGSFRRLRFSERTSNRFPTCTCSTCISWTRSTDARLVSLLSYRNECSTTSCYLSYPRYLCDCSRSISSCLRRISITSSCGWASCLASSALGALTGRVSAERIYANSSCIILVMSFLGRWVSVPAWRHTAGPFLSVFDPPT